MTATDEVNQPHALLAALRYAATGLRVLPIRPASKAPMLLDWPTRASVDTGTIRGWCRKKPRSTFVPTPKAMRE